LRTLRLIGRGASDTFEHLLPYAVLTLVWWPGLFLILTAPAATVALFAMTDPRRAVDRPDWRDALAVARANVVRGWGIALLTLPVVAVLAANLSAYSGSASRWSLFAPLLTLLLLLALATALFAFATAGLLATPARESAKLGAVLVLRRPLRSIALVLLALLLIGVGGALIVPLVLFVPALVAAIVNRLALDGLGLPVPDPLAPTPEREEEQRRRAASSRFGP
jgi:uncharacterized membrane protein YesL